MTAQAETLAITALKHLRAAELQAGEYGTSTDVIHLELASAVVCALLSIMVELEASSASLALIAERVEKGER